MNIISLRFYKKGRNKNILFKMNYSKCINFMDDNDNYRKRKQYIKKQVDEDISLDMLYEDDLNIVKVVNLVANKFKSLYKDKLNELQEKEKVLNLTDQKNMIDIKFLNYEINNIKNEMSKYSDDKLNEYFNKVKHLLEKYENVKPSPKVYSFVNDKVHQDDENCIERHKVISEFLKITKDYININITRIAKIETNKCPCCLTDLNNNPFLTYDSTYCSVCGVDISSLMKNDFHKDFNRTNLSNKNNYEDRENFIKALKRFQGKQQNRLPDKLFEDLTKYFSSYSLPSPEEIKKMPLNANGTRGNINREFVIKALSDTGNSDYYDDVNLITHILWDWKLPDLTEIENLILEDYDLSQKVYEKIKNSITFPGKTNRKSSINIQYRLMRHLTHRGYKCSINDFKIAKTESIIEYYEKIWAAICKELNWEMKSINELF